MESTEGKATERLRQATPTAEESTSNQFSNQHSILAAESSASEAEVETETNKSEYLPNTDTECLQDPTHSEEPIILNLPTELHSIQSYDDEISGNSSMGASTEATSNMR